MHKTLDSIGFCEDLERVMGIEPTWPAWKAGALPLSYTRSRSKVNGTRRIVNSGKGQ